MFSLHWFRHWDKIFWYGFVIMSPIVIIAGAAAILPFNLFLAFGFLMVIIGAGKLASEISYRKLMNYQNDIYQKMHQISQHLEKTFNLADMNRDKNEFRINKLHESRKEIRKAMDRNYRDLTRKIIDVENRLNKVSRVMAEKNVAGATSAARLTFSDKVLSLVRQIPKGKVTTFSEIARTAEKPRLSRLVGKTLADNIYLKSIPSYRVVSASGKVPNAGGMAAKKRISLLRKEKVKVEKGRVNLKKHLFKFVPEI